MGRGWSALALAAVLTLAACGNGSGSGAGGQAPAKHPDVTYQPDVVIVGGGEASVRSVADGGLTWRLAKDAKGARDLAPGKVMFVTGRGVGRVIDARPDGDELAVTIGPVELTEVIRDGSFSSPQPVRMSGAIAYRTERPFWAEIDPDKKYNKPGPRRHAPPKGNFTLNPVCCAGGVGTTFSYDDGGTVWLTGTMTLTMKEPSASFHVWISGGKVRQAELLINGAAGLRVDLKGGSRLGYDGNFKRTLPIPVDFSVPIGQILGVPFAATVNQVLTVRSAFSAKNSVLEAHGEYGFGGTLGFGYRDGKWGGREPQGFRVADSLTKSIDGLSIGVNGVAISYEAKFTIGIGAFGFTAGVYFGLTFGVGITLGTSIDLIECKGVKLMIKGEYGVGYSIPTVVADIINFFLRVFGTKPIKRSGGIGRTFLTMNKDDVIPTGVALCQGAAL